jgi:hypothetical protein
MTREEWIDKIVLSSIPLKQINERGMPINYASGCIISYVGKRLLLTVQHATGNMGNWVIETKYVPGHGTKGFRLGGMIFLKECNLTTGIWRDIDFSYVIIPDNIQPYFQEISPADRRIITETPRLINTVDFNVIPDDNYRYGFYGQTRIIKDDIQQYVLARHSIELDMQYLGIADDMYKFRLNREHPGHIYYQGCSGAPIIDSDGNVVALVVQGDSSENVIYGIALKRYKIAIDIECGIIK